MKPQRKMAAILFGDVKGYSALTELQIKTFAETALYEMAEPLKDHSPFYLNTWGDAVVAAFDDPLAAVKCALDLRDLFNNTNWAEKNLPSSLKLRLSLHAGVLFIGEDPIKGGSGLAGTQVNLAARIEPITRAGQVWATSQFVALFQQCQDDTIAYDDLGERPLAKRWGSERLYRFRRSMESPDIVEEVEEPAKASFDTVDSAMNIFYGGRNDEQRANALELLGQSNDARAITPLLEVLKDKTSSYRLRRIAAASLGDLRLPTAVQDMVDLLLESEEDVDIKDVIIVSLGKIGDVRAGQALLKVVTNNIPMPGVSRARALSALGDIGDNRYVPEVIDLVSKTEEEELVLQASALYFGKIRDIRAIPVLVGIAKDKAAHTENTRGSAIQTIGEIAPDLCVDALIDISKDADEPEGINRMAILCLAKARTPAAIQRLQEIGGDPSHLNVIIALAALMSPEKYLKIFEKK